MSVPSSTAHATTSTHTSTHTNTHTLTEGAAVSLLSSLALALDSTTRTYEPRANSTTVHGFAESGDVLIRFFLSTL